MQPSERINITEDQFLDLRGLSTYSSLAVPTLREYLKRDSLPHYKLRGKVLIKKSEFDHWLEKYRVDGEKKLNELAEDVIESLKN